MQTTMLLRNGVGTGYGLGVQVGAAGGRRQVSHTGEVSGFTAANVIYPGRPRGRRGADQPRRDRRVVSDREPDRDRAVPSRRPTPAPIRRSRRPKAVFEGLQHGRIDRGLFTANANAYFSEAALADFAAGLGPLGTPQEFEQANSRCAAA